MHTRSDEGFMRQALSQAEVALRAGWIPVGAVFVNDHRVVAHGRKTGIGHHLFDHAEHHGCYQTLWSREGPRNLKGFTVYTTLEPCLMCLSLLMTTRVSRIVYGLEDPYGGGTSILKNVATLPARFQDERPTILGGVLRKESLALLRGFFISHEQGSSPNWSDPNNPLVKLVMTAR